MWGGTKSNSKYSFVYVFRDLNHPNRFKIGMSNDPDQGAKKQDWRFSLGAHSLSCSRSAALC